MLFCFWRRRPKEQTAEQASAKLNRALDGLRSVHDDLETLRKKLRDIQSDVHEQAGEPLVSSRGESHVVGRQSSPERVPA